MRTIERFAQDARGVIAMLFAIVLVPIMLTIGLAIDYGHASSYKSEMQRVLDEAVIAGASTFAKTEDAVKAEAVARRRFDATKPKRYPIEMQVSVDETAGRLTAKVQSRVPMTFMALAGFTVLDVQANAVAVARRARSGGKERRQIASAISQLSEQEIRDVIYRVDRVCHQLRQMNMAGRVTQCQAVFDGSFADKLRARIASTGDAGSLLPGGVRLVQ